MSSPSTAAWLTYVLVAASGCGDRTAIDAETRAPTDSGLAEASVLPPTATQADCRSHRGRPGSPPCAGFHGCFLAFAAPDFQSGVRRCSAEFRDSLFQSGVPQGPRLNVAPNRAQAVHTSVGAGHGLQG